MMTLRLMITLSFLFVLQLTPAQAQQMDLEAMMRWGSADLIRYHIVGVYQAQTNVVGDSIGAGQSAGDGLLIPLRSHTSI